MGSKIHPDLVQSKLFFELVIEPFIGDNEVKELKGVHDNDDIEKDNENDLQWSVEPSDREDLIKKI